MTDEGPRFVNLALDGIFADDVCTRAAVKLKESIKFLPVTGNCKTGNDAVFSFSFKNTFTTPLKVTMTWMDDTDFSIQPKEKCDIVPPGATCSLPFRLKFTGQTTMAVPRLKCNFNTGKFRASYDCIPPLERLGSSWLEKWMEKMTRTVVRADCEPKIDGKLDDSIWQRPATVDGFFHFDLSGTFEPKTQTWFAYDDRNLYVAWRCSEDDMKTLVATVKKFDGPIWNDDSVELFLDTAMDRTHSYYFGLNSLGTLYDNLFTNGDSGPNFNSSAKTAVSHSGYYWTVELSVAWKNLNVQPPKIGTRMGYEVARQRPRGGSMKDSLSQFPPLGAANNHQPKLFGILVFGE